MALVPLLATALPFLATRAVGAGPAWSLLAMAGCAAISAGLGFLVVRRSGKGPHAVGLRGRRDGTITAILLGPRLPVVAVGLPMLLFGAQAHPATRGIVAAALAMAVLVALSDELWFRGLILAGLRGSGLGRAILVTAVLSTLLHLPTALAAPTALGAALQMLFLLLFGIVAAQVVVAMGSLWVMLVLHVGWSLVGALSALPPDPRVDPGLDAATYITGAAIAAIILGILALSLIPNVRRAAAARV
ncbi:CPBP family glutamic-type intramembrane protease [Brachybacterium sp. DNPG3]